MIDQEKVKKAVRLLLEGIGEDADREGLIETPDRIARMCEEIYGGYEEDAKEHLCKTFHVENSDMVVEKDVRASPSSFLRQSAHCVYSGRKSCGA